MIKSVVGYVRVSTECQAESGLGLEDQINKIKTYCSLYDLNLIEIVVDAGASAKSLEREGIQKIISGAKAGAFGGVVVAELDRLTRSMRDLHKLLDEVFGAVELHSVAEKVDTSSAAGRLVLNVLMSVAEWERETIGAEARFVTVSPIVMRAAALASRSASGVRSPIAIASPV